MNQKDDLISAGSKFLTFLLVGPIIGFGATSMNEGFNLPLAMFAYLYGALPAGVAGVVYASVDALKQPRTISESISNNTLTLLYCLCLGAIAGLIGLHLGWFLSPSDNRMDLQLAVVPGLSCGFLCWYKLKKAKEMQAEKISPKQHEIEMSKTQ